MPRLVLAAALAAALAPAALAQPCTRTWAAPVDGTWSSADNWSPAEVPGPGDVACITAAGTYTVSIGGFVSVSVETLVVGGASGTQGLTSQGIVSVGSAEVRPTGRLEVVDITPGGGDGLYATGTVAVEGEVVVTGGTSFLTAGGTLDVAPGGVLRLVDGASAGGAAALFRIRGTLDAVCPPTAYGFCSLHAPVEVVGGTVQITTPAAEGFLTLDGGGSFTNATVDAGASATLLVQGASVVEGTLSGTPAGAVFANGGTFSAGPAGATLAVGGTGLQLAGSVSLRSAGGSFTNIGLLREAFTGSNFSSLRAVTVRNRGTVEFTAGFELYDDAVLRNEPGATVLFSAGNGLSGAGRFENAGLLLRQGNQPGIGPEVDFGGLLVSEAGSEIRIGAGTQVTLDAPGAQTLPAGATVTGSGTLGAPFALDPEGTLSPGTDAEPLATLTVASYFRPSLAAGDPRLVIDVDTGGLSDVLDVLFAPGSQNTRLGGTLVVRVRPGYAPQAGDTFTILTSGSAIDGAFGELVVEGSPDAAFTAEVSADGLSVVLTSTVTVGAENAPGAASLAVDALASPSAVPALRATLTAGADLVVELYDTRGRRVARLAEGTRPAGSHVVAVPRLAPGVYLARVMAVGASGTEVATCRLTVVR